MNDPMKIVRRGDASGNDMILRMDAPSGRRVYGLPTKNFYGGDWDLGPTWNWLVLGDRPFLLDAGRYGQSETLVDMMAEIGVSPEDVDTVYLSHGHEDHDGGVAEVVGQTGARLRVHRIYELLIRRYPALAPTPERRDWPARCWHCFMPESFHQKHCQEYQRENRELAVETFNHPEGCFEDGVRYLHTPGHSPDAAVYWIDDQIALVGDTILPQITPWPTTKKMYGQVAPVLREEYPDPADIYGLDVYLRSLAGLKQAAGGRQVLALPAHRVFYEDRFHPLDLTERIDELFEHHRQRCAAILELSRSGPLTSREAALRYFEEKMLKGPGLRMGENEVLSHLEFMETVGDVVRDGERFAFSNGADFEKRIDELKHGRSGG